MSSTPFYGSFAVNHFCFIVYNSNKVATVEKDLKSGDFTYEKRMKLESSLTSLKIERSNAESAYKATTEQVCFCNLLFW